MKSALSGYILYFLKENQVKIISKSPQDKLKIRLTISDCKAEVAWIHGYLLIHLSGENWNVSAIHFYKDS